MSRMTTDELLAKYPHYYKDVRHLEVVDVYRVCALFGVTDPTAQHALKKILVPGKRGGKSEGQDLDEAMHTLERGAIMREEDAKNGLLNTTVTVNVTNTSGVVSKEQAERIAARYLTPQPPPLAPPVADEALVDALHEYLTGATNLLPAVPVIPTAPEPRDVNKCSMGGCSSRREVGSLFCLAHQVPQAAPVPTEDVGIPPPPTSWKPMEPLSPPPPPMPPSNAKPPTPVCHQPGCIEKVSALICPCNGFPVASLPVETPNLPAPELPVDGLALAVHNGVNAGEPGKLPRL